MRSLLVMESLGLSLGNQYILVSESPSCLRFEKMCVPGKVAIEMKSKVFDMVLLRYLQSQEHAHNPSMQAKQSNPHITVTA
jgi:hypothetical protein